MTFFKFAFATQDLNGQAKELCPRRCHLKKGPTGYGFNLHSEKSRPGQFIRSVDPDSPAYWAGLRPQDKLIEVTGNRERPGAESGGFCRLAFCRAGYWQGALWGGCGPLAWPSCSFEQAPGPQKAARS